MKRFALLLTCFALLLSLTACAGMETWPETKDSPMIEHDSPRP